MCDIIVVKCDYDTPDYVINNGIFASRNHPDKEKTENIKIALVLSKADALEMRILAVAGFDNKVRKSSQNDQNKFQSVWNNHGWQWCFDLNDCKQLNDGLGYFITNCLNTAAVEKMKKNQYFAYLNFEDFLPQFKNKLRQEARKRKWPQSLQQQLP